MHCRALPSLPANAEYEVTGGLEFLGVGMVIGWSCDGGSANSVLHIIPYITAAPEWDDMMFKTLRSARRLACQSGPKRQQH
jgi:hypothetical protein